MSTRSTYIESSLAILSFVILAHGANLLKARWGIYLQNEVNCRDNDFFSDHLPRPLPVQVSESKLKSDLEELSSYSPSPSLEHPTSLRLVGREIGNRLRAMRVNLREVLLEDGVPCSAWIASVGEHEGKKIVLLAPFGEVDGRLDETGAAVLLELLREIEAMKSISPIRIPVDIIFYPADSIQIADLFRRKEDLRPRRLAMAEDVQSIHLAIVVDSLEKFSTVEGSQTYPKNWLSDFYPKIGNFLFLLGRTQDRDLTCHVKAMFRKGTHANFVSLNLPSSLSGFHFPIQEQLSALGVPSFVLSDTKQYRTAGVRPSEPLRPLIDAEHALLSFLIEASKELVF